MIPSHYNYPADAQGPALEDGRRRHGSDQGHDPIRQRRRPGGDGSDRPARRQGHDARRVEASESPCATHRRRSSPTSSSATRSRGPSEKRVGPCGTSACPDQKRIYGVNIKAEPSTRFADWIETNLLKVEASQDPPRRFRQLQDPGRSQQAGRGPGAAARREIRRSLARIRRGRGRWTACPAGQELNEDKLRSLIDAVARSQDRRRSAQAARPEKPRTRKISS